MTADEQLALGDALAAEHTAIYTYGVLSAYLAAPAQAVSAAATAAHQARRDGLVDALVALGATAAPAAPGYLIPVPITDAVSAARVAVVVESDCAVAWRSALERSAASSAPAGSAPAGFDVRASAVAALADCAIRAAGWRAAAGVVPATTAFPGQPGPG